MKRRLLTERRATYERNTACTATAHVALYAAMFFATRRCLKSLHITREPQHTRRARGFALQPVASCSHCHPRK